MVGIKTRNKNTAPAGPEKERQVEKPVTAIEIARTNLLDKTRTSIIRAKEIFGEDMYCIDDSIDLFGISSKLKMNSSLMTVPFSEAQLKMMYGYTLLAVAFPSTMRVVRKNKRNVRISEAILCSQTAKAVFEKNMYPRFHLIMKSELSSFLEVTAQIKARAVGLIEENTNLLVQISILLLGNSKAAAIKSIRSVSFPSPESLKVVVKYNPKKTPEIFIKSVKSTAPIRKSISWTAQLVSK
jgi:hypothetical protein